MSRLTSLRHILDRHELLLGECDDDEAGQLLCEVKAVARDAAFVEASDGPDPREREVFDRGMHVLTRVRAYASLTGRDWYTVDTPAPSSDDTLTTVLSSEHMYVLAHGMPRGATEPPNELLEAALEAQGIGRYSTAPCPPPVEEPEDARTKPTTRDVSDG